MQDVRRPVFMLFLLLITSLSPMLLSQPSSGEIQLAEIHSPSEAERLELASSLWNIAEPIPVADVEIRISTGILRLQAGEYDPLLSDGPMLDGQFSDINDPSKTALAFLQLNHHDGKILESVLQYSKVKRRVQASLLRKVYSQ